MAIESKGSICYSSFFFLPPRSLIVLTILLVVVLASAQHTSYTNVKRISYTFFLLFADPATRRQLRDFKKIKKMECRNAGFRPGNS